MTGVDVTVEGPGGPHYLSIDSALLPIGISATPYDEEAQSLRLDGEGTVEEYETAFELVRYWSTQQHPVIGTLATITVAVELEYTPSMLQRGEEFKFYRTLEASMSIVYHNVNDPPWVSTHPSDPAAPYTVGYLHSWSMPVGVQVCATCMLGDVDNDVLLWVRVTIEDVVAGDLLFLDPEAELEPEVASSATYFGESGALVISGPASADELTAALQAVMFMHESNDIGFLSRNVMVSVSDGSAESAESIGIVIILPEPVVTASPSPSVLMSAAPDAPTPTPTAVPVRTPAPGDRILAPGGNTEQGAAEGATAYYYEAPLPTTPPPPAPTPVPQPVATSAPGSPPMMVIQPTPTPRVVQPITTIASSSSTTVAQVMLGQMGPSDRVTIPLDMTDVTDLVVSSQQVDVLVPSGAIPGAALTINVVERDARDSRLVSTVVIDLTIDSTTESVQLNSAVELCLEGEYDESNVRESARQQGYGRRCYRRGCFVAGCYRSRCCCRSFTLLCALNTNVETMHRLSG